MAQELIILHEIFNRVLFQLELDSWKKKFEIFIINYIYLNFKNITNFKKLHIKMLKIRIKHLPNPRALAPS